MTAIAMSKLGAIKLDPHKLMAAGSLRTRIGQRMQRVNRCVSSEGFCNALGAAMEDPQRAQFLMSVSNLRGAGATLPPDATIHVRPRYTRENFGISLGLPPVRVTFNFGYPSPVGGGYAPSLRVIIPEHMRQVETCVASQGFCYGLEEVLNRSGPQSGSDIMPYAQSILSTANLAGVLRVQLPPGALVVDGPFYLWHITLNCAPVEVMFSYPN